jgi:hypothetical protein
VADEKSSPGTREIDRWRASQFRNFAGARLDIRVPLGEDLLNDFIERHLLPRVSSLRSVTLRLSDANRLAVRVESAKWPWLPPITIPLEIDPDLSAGPAPRARLHITGSGVAGTLAPLMRFVTLPAAVRVANRIVEIDINSFLSPADAATLTEWLRDARVTTTAGTLWLEVRLALEDDEGSQ